MVQGRRIHKHSPIQCWTYQIDGKRRTHKRYKGQLEVLTRWQGRLGRRGLNQLTSSQRHGIHLHHATGVHSVANLHPICRLLNRWKVKPSSRLRRRFDRRLMGAFEYFQD